MNTETYTVPYILTKSTTTCFFSSVLASFSLPVVFAFPFRTCARLLTHWSHFNTLQNVSNLSTDVTCETGNGGHANFCVSPQIANTQILGLKFRRCASPQIANFFGVPVRKSQIPKFVRQDKFGTHS